MDSTKSESTLIAKDSAKPKINAYKPVTDGYTKPLATIKSMKFSERLKYNPVKDELQIEKIDRDLKNTLYSVFMDGFIKELKPYNQQKQEYELYNYCYSLWLNFFKLPTDTAPIGATNSVSSNLLHSHIKNFIFGEYTKWYEIYDLIEYSSEFFSEDYYTVFNSFLEREKAGYRFINKQIAPIYDQIEILEIEEALSEDSFHSVQIHLSRALKLLSDKSHPDYRNSIKESISSIESICKIYTGNPKSTLGQTLKKLESDNDIHPALKKAFTSLYGYTSDDGGIRHALTENDREVDFHEAKFMLVTCSSFINYIKGRMI